MVRLVVALASLVALAAPSLARPPGPFDQGRMRISLSGGTAGGFNNTYIILGGGVGWFVVDGLELGISGSAWLGGEPFIADVSPQVRYVFHQVPVLKPYVGAFYEHQFLGEVGGIDLDDVDSVGGRAGFFYVTGAGGFLGGGVGYAHRLSCNAQQLGDFCDGRFFPELVFSLVF